MKKNHVIAFLVGAALLVGSVSAIAHHAISAEFDTNNRVTFTGTVKKIDWMNPHIYTHVEVKQADGKTVVYLIEGGPPNALFRQGVRKEQLPIGTVVTCTNCSRSKSPSSMHVNGNMTLANGQRALGPPGGPAN
jgi:hypothetical protein